jgi:hypothetical protein
MLAPNPDHRFASYGHLIDQLQRAYRALPADGEPAPRSKWLRGWPLAAAVAALAVAIAGGVYITQTRKAAEPVIEPVAPKPAAMPDNAAALREPYEAARRQLIEGKFDAAATAFTKLASQARNLQPLQNWISLHRGLAALLQGKASQARESFQEIERAGSFSNAAADAGLVRFFLETARRLVAAGPIRSDSVTEVDAKSVQVLAPFLFAIKNWQLSDFNEAAALLERFTNSAPAAEFAWINDYKPLAQKFLQDHRVYTEWKQMPPPSTVADIRTKAAQVRALEGKLIMRGALADALKDEGKKLATEIAQREKLEKEAREAEGKKRREEQTPILAAAVANARRQAAVYDFAGGLAALESAQITEPSLKEAQAAEIQKMRWLIEWKKKLSAGGRFAAPVEIGGANYTGVAGATDAELRLQIGGFGEAARKWAELPPKALLAISTALITAKLPDVAERQWLAAVFAHETGQTDAVTPLAEAAAKAEPRYRDLLRLLKSKPPG